MPQLGVVCPQCSASTVLAGGEGRESARSGVLGSVRRHSWAGAAPNGLRMEPALGGAGTGQQLEFTACVFSMWVGQAYFPLGIVIHPGR